MVGQLFPLSTNLVDKSESVDKSVEKMEMSSLSFLRINWVWSQWIFNSSSSLLKLSILKQNENRISKPLRVSLDLPQNRLARNDAELPQNALISSKESKNCIKSGSKSILIWAKRDFQKLCCQTNPASLCYPSIAAWLWCLIGPKRLQAYRDQTDFSYKKNILVVKN